jgi:hypothetical protein
MVEVAFEHRRTRSLDIGTRVECATFLFMISSSRIVAFLPDRWLGSLP